MLAFIDNLLLGLRFRQKGIVLVAIPLIFEIVFVSVLSMSYGAAEKESLLADHGRRVLTITDAMTSGLFALGASVFLSSVTAPSTLEARSMAVEAKLTALLESLLVETKPYPDEQKFVSEIETCMRDLDERAKGMRVQVTDPMRLLNPPNMRQSMKQARKSLTRLAAALDNLINYEQSMSGPRLAQAHKARQQLHLLLYGGVGLNILLSIYIALIFGKQITNRLQVVSRNAVRMSHKEQLSENVPGTDELAELDVLMHKLSGMLIETSRRERAMIDNTIDLICALSPELNVLSVNAAASKQWGWSEDVMSDASVLDIILTDNREQFVKELEECRKTSSARNFECSMVRRDGTLIESRWSVLWSDRDKSFFSIVRDVGAEKEAERFRRRFFSMITHDLRSPLANFQTFLEMLHQGQYGTLHTKGEEMLNRVQESVDFLAHLANDLLDIGKLEAGQVKLSVESFKAEMLVDECCAVLETMSKSQSIRLNVEMTEDYRVLGDFMRLKQVLVNLLSNAIKFSPNGSTITIGICRENQFVRISVKDQGPGMTEDECKIVFDMYAQANNQKLAKMKGFGLGLSIVKTIAEAHGGRVGVNSIYGSGTEFWFEVPEATEESLVSQVTLGDKA